VPGHVQFSQNVACSEAISPSRPTPPSGFSLDPYGSIYKHQASINGVSSESVNAAMAAHAHALETPSIICAQSLTAHTDIPNQSNIALEN